VLADLIHHRLVQLFENFYRYGFTAENLIATGLSVLLLVSRKIPAPLIVFAALIAGIMI